MGSLTIDKIVMYFEHFCWQSNLVIWNDSTTQTCSWMLKFTCSIISIVKHCVALRVIVNCLLYSFFCCIYFNFQANESKKIFTYAVNAFECRNLSSKPEIVETIVNKWLQSAIKFIVMIPEKSRKFWFSIKFRTNLVIIAMHFNYFERWL